MLHDKHGGDIPNGSDLDRVINLSPYFYPLPLALCYVSVYPEAASEELQLLAN